MKLAFQLPGTFGLALLALSGILCGVDFNRSTGDLVYEDGEGSTLPYRLFLPEDYDENVGYPLVLFFHGAGERGRDNKLQANGGGHIENLFKATQGTIFNGRYKAFLLTPQCPSNDQWVNWPWSRGSYTDVEEPEEGRSMRSALAILDQVIATYPVAIDQIYVTGLSMGGFGTLDSLRRRPGKFAAALPLSGGGNKSQGASFKDVPIWLYHGSSDTEVPTKSSDEMQDAIVAAGGSIEYTRPNRGHSGWGTFYDNRTYSNAAGQPVFEWLFSQTLQGPLQPLIITEIAVSRVDDDAEITLRWNSRPRTTYVIQRLQDNGSWTDLPFAVETLGETTSTQFRISSGIENSIFRVKEGLPSADLLEESNLRWLVPADNSLHDVWNARVEPDGAGFSNGIGPGVGFETRPDAFDPLIDTYVLDAMLKQNASIYLRYEFDLPPNRKYTALDLGMRYDDGFIAYLNGTRIASENALENSDWDALATRSHPDSKAIEFEIFNLSEFIHVLRPEGNVLAIQGMNTSLRGSDFLIEPRLIGEFGGL